MRMHLAASLVVRPDIQSARQTNDAQARRFTEAARKLEASEDAAALDESYEQLLRESGVTSSCATDDG